MRIIIHPKYASVIVQRYVDAAGGANVHVLRDGQKLSYEQVVGQ